MEAEPIQNGGPPPVQGNSTRPSKRGPNPAPPPSTGGDNAPVDVTPVDTVTLSSQGQASAKAPTQENGNASPLRQFDVTDNQEVILKIVNRETGEVERQVPPEEQIRLNEAIRKTVDDITNNNNQTE